MAIAKLKSALIKNEKKIFEEHGLIFFPEVIVQAWDPYSIAPERDKIFSRLQNAWLKLNPDGEVTLEALEKGYYISQHLAERLAKEEGVPLHHLEHTDRYETKLEADLMQQPLITVPEKIEVEGAIIPYAQPILQSLIIAVIERFGNGKATKTQIIDYLTQQPPDGGGWLTRTPTIIEKVDATLEKMVYKGILDYNKETGEYSVITKPTTTTLRRK